MKTTKYIFIILLVGFTLINLSAHFVAKETFFQISGGENDGYNKGDLVVFKVYLSGTEYLTGFEIIPEVRGENEDSFVSFDFYDGTRQASMNYFYVIPQNINTNEITIYFNVKSNNRERIIKKSIKVN